MTVLPADLSSTEAVDRLISDVESRGLRIDILVNNAGFGVFKDFLATTFSKQIGQVDVNVRARLPPLFQINQVNE